MERDIERSMAPAGELALEVLPAPIFAPISLEAIQRWAHPRVGLSDEVNDWRAENIKRDPFQMGVEQAMAARAAGEQYGIFHAEGMLFGKVIRRDGSVLNLGLMGLNIVTTAGVTYMADAFRGTTELENMRYHGLGTGATAEVIGNTALQTELTTQYNPDNTRATGTLAGSANVYTTVGTNTVDASASVTEWGLLSQAATGGGSLLDRETFTAVALAASDSLQTTYNFTLTAGG